jgi:hypothetical protein
MRLCGGELLLSAGVIGFFGDLVWKNKFEVVAQPDGESESSVIGDKQSSPAPPVANHDRAGFSRRFHARN